MSFKVCNKMCATCIFTKKSPINRDRFAELKDTWEEENRIQQCHTSTKDGGTVACRGHYNAAKNGEMPYSGFETTFDFVFPYLTPKSLQEKLQIAERLGLVTFVELDSGDES